MASMIQSHVATRREVLVEPAGADERVRGRREERVGLHRPGPLEPLARDLAA